LSFSWSRLRLWPTFALGLGLLVSLSTTFAVRHQAGRRQAQTARLSREPIPALVVSLPAVEPVAPDRLAQQTEAAPEAAAPPRFDYDLERGTPMGPDAPEVKSKLTH
jgi:hypothetical protein